MKTEQEQIEEMQEIIGDCYEFDSTSAGLGSGDGYINIEEAAQALIKAGYGDVAVHKAYIAQLEYDLADKEHLDDLMLADLEKLKTENAALKAENEELQTQKRILADGVNELNKENWVLEEELKKKEREITWARNDGYKKSYDECEKYTRIEVKKAQLDILFRVQERLICEGRVSPCWLKNLIKEVQNAEDKS